MRYDGRKLVSVQEPAADEAWIGLQAILRAAATAQPQPRENAARYVQLREILLKSSYQPRLPGFLLQCLSLDRFRDFIQLYHPHLEARIELLNRSFQAGGIFPRSGRDFLADPEF